MLLLGYCTWPHDCARQPSLSQLFSYTTTANPSYSRWLGLRSMASVREMSLGFAAGAAAQRSVAKPRAKAGSNAKANAASRKRVRLCDGVQVDNDLRGNQAKGSKRKQKGNEPKGRKRKQKQMGSGETKCSDTNPNGMADEQQMQSDHCNDPLADALVEALDSVQTTEEMEQVLRSLQRRWGGSSTRQSAGRPRTTRTLMLFALLGAGGCQGGSPSWVQARST